MEPLVFLLAILVTILDKFANAHAIQHVLTATPLAFAKRNALLFCIFEQEIGTRNLHENSFCCEFSVF